MEVEICTKKSLMAVKRNFYPSATKFSMEICNYCYVKYICQERSAEF